MADYLMVDDHKIMLDDLNSDQQYYYSQMVEIKEKIKEGKRELDVLHMALKGFEDMIVESLKETLKPLKPKTTKK